MATRTCALPERTSLYPRLRYMGNKPVKLDGRDVMPDVRAVLDAMRDFSHEVRDGTIKGVTGQTFTDVEAYLRHLAKNLNEGYVASRDMKNYAEALRGVAAGTLTVKDAIMKMPKLKRVGGTCPCSKGVRWVMEGSAADKADLTG